MVGILNKTTLIQLFYLFVACLLLTLPFEGYSQAQTGFKNTSEQVDYAYFEIDKFTSVNEIKAIEQYLITPKGKLITFEAIESNAQNLLTELKFTIEQHTKDSTKVKSVELISSSYITPIYIIVEYKKDVTTNVYYTTTYPSELENIYISSDFLIEKQPPLPPTDLDMATYIYNLIESSTQNELHHQSMLLIEKGLQPSNAEQP